MKRILSVLFLLAIVFNVDAQSKEEISYYYKGQKLYLSISYDRVLIEVKTGRQVNSLRKRIARSMRIPEDSVELTGIPNQVLAKFGKNVQRQMGVAAITNLSAVSGILFAHPVFISASGKYNSYGKEFIVKLKPGIPFADVRKLINTTGSKLVRKYPFHESIFILSAGAKSRYNGLDMANQFYESGLFEYAEPEMIVYDARDVAPNDPLYNLQWSHRNTGSAAQFNGTPGVDMKVQEAWAYTMGSSSIKVGVIDDGVDLTHPDLQANLLQGFNGATLTSNPGDGGPLTSGNAHGTNCAGIIAAVANNSIGVAGVAPNCKIIPAVIFNGNTFLGNTAVASSFDYVRLQGADVISNSWGGGSPSGTIDDAINRALTLGRGGKGCVVLFSSGNDNAGAVSYPASNPQVISVGGISMCDQRKSPSSCDGETWWGANYGPGLDIVAPAVKIASTDIQGTGGYNTAAGTAGNYLNTFNGTSSSCPNAAGVMALILSFRPALTGTEAARTLFLTSNKMPAYAYGADPNFPNYQNGTWNNETGYGRVNALAALEFLASSCTFPEITAPTVVQPNCPPATGTITLSATGSGTLEYSINGGASYQDSEVFTNLQLGSYNIYVRTKDAPQGCFSIYPGNPIVISSPIIETSTISYTGEAVSIPDNNAAGVNIPLTFSGNGTLITDINFRLDAGTAGVCNNTAGNTNASVNHTWNSDLIFKLTSPSGTTVTLISRRGGSGDNFCTVTLDDDATNATSTMPSTGAITGNYRPESLLSAFNEQNPNGTWILNVSDVANQDVGVLRRFSLIISAGVPCPPPPPCTPPTITAPQVTQPTCLVPTGTIVVEATGTETMQYSIDDGATYENSASFPNLPPGDQYLIKVRYLATPNCVSTFTGNPITINPPPATPIWYLDADNDGYYSSSQSGCISPGEGWTSTLPLGGSGDCNDNNASINPGAAEVCNGIDDNCNGQTDEGCPITWTGAVNNLWNVAGNWLQNIVPSSGDDILIPLGTPKLNTDFTVAGSLSINGTGTLAIDPHKTLTISGSADFGNRPVVVKSTADGTGSIGVITGTLTNATDVTVERFIPPTAGRAWRLLTIPVSSSTATIRDAWAGGAALRVYDIDLNNVSIPTQIAGTGTIITGHAFSTAMAANTAGYDWWPDLWNSTTNKGGATSLKRYTPAANADGKWLSNVASRSTIGTLLNATDPAYMLFVRGDRTVTTGNGSTTLIPSGTLKTGNISQPVPATTSAKFFIYGNPYASSVDFEQLLADNPGKFAPEMWIWNAGLDGWQTVKKVAGIWTAVPGGEDPGVQYIQSGQGIMLQTISSAATIITTRESHKTSGLTPITPFEVPGGNSQPGLLFTNLHARNINGSLNLLDGALAVFTQGNSHNINDAYDIAKMGSFNRDISVSFIRNGALLSIEGRPTINSIWDTLHLDISGLTSGSFTLSFTAQNLAAQGAEIFLLDKHLLSTTALTNEGVSQYDFTVNTSASAMADRFSIVQRSGTLLPVTLLSIQAAQQQNDVLVSWHTASESNMSHYEVLYSRNGIDFGKAKQIEANNTNAAKYQWLHVQPEAGNHFYKINAVDKEGNHLVSKVVKVTLGGMVPAFTVYPNPMDKGNQLTLQMEALPPGTYSLQVMDAAGRVLQAQTLPYAGGSAAQVIQLPNGLPPGKYFISISGNGKQYLETVMKL